MVTSGRAKRSTTASRATWSMTTVSACASKVVAATVSRPGSPGPAPTKATRPGRAEVEDAERRLTVCSPVTLDWTTGGWKTVGWKTAHWTTVRWTTVLWTTVLWTTAP